MKLKLSKRGIEALKTINGKFAGWSIMPDRYDWNATPSNVVRKISSFKDQLSKLSSIGRKARKDIFFRKKVLTHVSYKSSWMDQKKAHWEKINDKATSDVGLLALHDVLGTKKKALQKMNAAPVIKIGDKSGYDTDWLEKRMAKFKFDEVSELEKKVDSHYKIFSKNPPNKRHIGEFKNISRQEITGPLSQYHFDTNKVNGFHDPIFQPAEIEFGKGSVGKKLKALKKIRKDIVLNNPDKFGKTNSLISDLSKIKVKTINKLIEKKSSASVNVDGLSIKQLKKARKDAATGRLRFIRKNGKIIPIRTKE